MTYVEGLKEQLCKVKKFCKAQFWVYEKEGKLDYGGKEPLWGKKEDTDSNIGI